MRNHNLKDFMNNYGASTSLPIFNMKNIIIIICENVLKNKRKRIFENCFAFFLLFCCNIHVAGRMKLLSMIFFEALINIKSVFLLKMCFPI